MHAAALVLGATTTLAAVNDPAFVETQVVKVPSAITSMAWAPDGSQRLFVTTKLGEIRLIANGTLLATPFATLSPVYVKGECGLLGLAFDPSFSDNGYVYVFVTISATEQQIVRYRADGNLGGEPTLIVGGLPTVGANHNGGGLGFGPDGKLYWSIGDNGSTAGTNDDLALLSAKVGRANADGSVPLDNPFYDGDGPNNDYIWARGFRNPYTLTFQPSTGRLWLNVVGRRYEQIFTPQAGDHGGWVTYESNQPAPFLEPVVSYNTNSAPAHAIPPNGAVRTNGVATITTKAVHRLRPGAKITLAGVTDASFDGSAYIASVTAETLSFAQAGPDAMSGGGTATPLEIGGAITGGTFWDASSGPSTLRGDFLFGDYNTGRVMRVHLAPDNTVKQVDEWGTGLPHVIDMAMGPDGDLYTAQTNGVIMRQSYQSPTPGLVVSPSHVRLQEGGSGAFNVRLASDPGGAREVTVEPLSGDDDVAVVGAATLTFDSGSWSVPQRVVLGAAVDPDGNEDVAQFQVRSAGLMSELVDVRVTDVQTGNPDPGAGGSGAAGESSAGNGAASTAGAAAGGVDQTDPDPSPSAGQSTGGAGGHPDEPNPPSEGGQAGHESATPTSHDASGCDCLMIGSPHQADRPWAAAFVLLALGARAARRKRRN